MITTKALSCPVKARFTDLSHLLFALGFGGFSVGIVVCFDQDQVIRLWVDDKLARCVLQWEGHLVKDGTQFLKSQNPEGGKDEIVKKACNKFRGRVKSLDISYRLD